MAAPRRVEPRIEEASPNRRFAGNALASMLVSSGDRGRATASGSAPALDPDSDSAVLDESFHEPALSAVR